MGIDAFVAKWLGSSGAERANKDTFVVELCDALGVPRPDATTGDPERDAYVFERDAVMPVPGGKTTIGKIDLYKRGCFVFEAKQGSDEGAAKIGTARRGTPGWHIAMREAYGQALQYARSFDEPVPFLVVCDLGHCFDLYAAFDGSWAYRPFPNAASSRLYLKDLAAHADTLRALFTDPRALDPARRTTKVTREVAAHVADLAKALEAAKHPPELVAKFLMRCLFTMFAEDVGLLPTDPASGQGLFTHALATYWLPSPASFPAGIEGLWRAMNAGGEFGFVGKLLRFNGGLFAQPSSLPLTKEHLALLLDAAKCDWSEVEPAIFGTLLERALDPKERHALGAHFTPRAYVERLVRPTIEEPLRAEWDLVQAEVRQIVAAAGPEPAAPNLDKDEYLARTEAERKAIRAAYDKAVKRRDRQLDGARDAVRAFHAKLCATKVLDPACGSGNFLYVTLDLFQRLEDEVLALLRGLGETQELAKQDTVRVTPAQFLGIEIKPWAKEIAELVLWIGYLQHHVRAHGRASPPPEPVLQDYKNIECRDAVLAYDDKVPATDEHGKPLTRWDGETMKKSPVTGEDIPDETARVPVWKYVNPRKAEWPKADFIVGNPPFVGNWRMRTLLGDGYVESLRRIHEDMPDTSDFVLYWWDQAATLMRSGEAPRSFGFITTNSVTQTFGRKVFMKHMSATPPVHIAFAIPDHPWVDSAEGAAVRIAMTVARLGRGQGQLQTVIAEQEQNDEAAVVHLGSQVGLINSDLTVGADVTSAVRLRSNSGISCPGVKLHGAGFIVTRDEATRLRASSTPAPAYVREYRNGKDLAQRSRDVCVIDLFGLTDEEARSAVPALYQHVFERVKPERDTNARDIRRRNWWLFGEPVPKWRAMASGLSRYVSTVETSKHRVFHFLGAAILPDNMLINIASDDAFVLGVLSSTVHVAWALAAGGHLGVGNDPRYNKTRCFDPFPFPACTDAQAQKIRDLGEQLDAHRKRQQALHADLTITGMYNVLEKLRSGEPLTLKEKIIHEQGLVSVLKQIHDDLDAAVFDAYGWKAEAAPSTGSGGSPAGAAGESLGPVYPPQPRLTDEQILEKLVALNAERAEEERNGLVRWLRPEFQNPGGAKQAAQVALVGVDAGEGDEDEGEAAAAKRAPWPKKLPEQLAAVRDTVARSDGAWTIEQVAASFAGAKRDEVAEALVSLGALGLLVRYDEGGGTRWRGAVRGAA